MDSQAHLYTVHLSESLRVGQTLNLVAETVETHATTAWPSIVAQTDKQSLKYNTSVYIVSPYNTAVQRTKIR
jgi:oligosaccharyltransferase complex subunit alpha (ribophorin I)